MEKGFRSMRIGTGGKSGGNACPRLSSKPSRTQLRSGFLRTQPKAVRTIPTQLRMGLGPNHGGLAPIPISSCSQLRPIPDGADRIHFPSCGCLGRGHLKVWCCCSRVTMTTPLLELIEVRGEVWEEGAEASFELSALILATQPRTLWVDALGGILDGTLCALGALVRLRGSPEWNLGACGLTNIVNRTCCETFESSPFAWRILSS